MKHLRLFENFDQPINEGAIKRLWHLIDSIDGNADLDPSTQWTPEEAIDWGVGFAREYGLWHPDENAQDIIWDGETPPDLDKADKQMENFSNVDWKSSGMGANLDQYVVAMFITNVVENHNDQDAWINKPAYQDEVKAMSNILESRTAGGKLVDKHGNEFGPGKTQASKNVAAIVDKIDPVAYWTTGSGGGFFHDFFLLDDGTVVSFHYATGNIYLSDKKYSEEDFNGESEQGFDTPLGDDFESDTQDQTTMLLTHEVDNDDDRGYPDKEFNDVAGLVKKIKNREHK